MKLRTLSLAAVLLAIAAPAFAHPGHVGSGFLHPFTGIDHLLAMVGVGMWAALLAVRRPAAAFWLPAAFLLMMALGAAAGFAGIKLPFAEAGVLASIFVLGGVVAAGIRVPTSTAMLVVSWFAALHGYSHALAAPAADPGQYVLGFLLATALLLTAGLGVGSLVQRLAGGLGLRALGGLVMAGGALVLATQ